MQLGEYPGVAREEARQERWARERVHATPDAAAEAPSSYIFAAVPFTSGSIHLGHIRSYTIADVYARYRRMAGDAVLFAIGFDSFGLPAELEAIRRGIPTSTWGEQCCTNQRRQLRRMGFSFDWEREFVSSDEQMYQWSQWLFLAFLKAGLVYRANGNVDWCDSCETVLANIQVEQGCCWRCHQSVRLVKRTQWYLRVSAYLEENEARLDELPEPDKAWLSSQRAVLGRVDGVELDAVASDGRRLSVFTPYPEAVRDACFVAMSPRHPALSEWSGQVADAAQLDELRDGGWARADRSARDTPVVDAGCLLGIDGVPVPLPLVITRAVDARYGETAILGIPSVDRTDELLAGRIAVAPRDSDDLAPGAVATRPAVRYRARDFTISRQRSWGTPIPIVNCASCGEVPVPAQDLPVRLPRDVQPTGSGNPLAERPDFFETDCPRCGEPARRETDTLDCHFDGIWMCLPICVPRTARSHTMFEHEELARWLPGKRIVWGADGGGYIFDQRMTTKALRDHGELRWLSEGEPFRQALMHEMVQLDGRKMSKHLGNVVDPDVVVREFGADAVRLAVLLAASPRSRLTWTEEGLRRSRDILARLWTYAEPRLRATPPAAGIDKSEPLRRRLARWCDAATRRVTEDLDTLELHRAAENVVQLLANVQKFESRARARRGQLDAEDEEAVGAALRLLVRLLMPFAPHIGEELWELGGDGFACQLPWPTPDTTVAS